MKRRFLTWLKGTIILGVTFGLSMFIYIKVAQFEAKRLFEKVKDHKKLYVYETYYKVLNAVFYVKDVKDTGELISYYSKIEKLDTATAYINFDYENRFLTVYEPIYEYENLSKGSKIKVLIDFNSKCWGYDKGYFYEPTTHDVAAPDSLIKKEEISLEEDRLDKQKQKIARISKKISPYGWYCTD